jgi:AcrR family transcriptional regulator
MASEPSTPDTTRQRVLRISAELFATRGYHGTGMQELSDAVRLGRGALYYHIRSKEDLLVEIVTSPIEDVLDRAEKIEVDGVDVVAKIRQMSRALMGSVADKRPQWTVFLREFSSLSAVHQRAVLVLRARYLAVWERVIDEGIRQGIFPDSNLFFVNGILGLYVYSYIWSAPQQSMSVDAAADAISDLLLHGLRGSSDTAGIAPPRAAWPRTDPTAQP